MHYVYVIKSQKDGRLYVGMTTNLEQRIKEHNAGYQFSTKDYKPWTLVHFRTFPTRQEARIMEKYFKSGYGKEHLRTIIEPR